MAVVLCKMSKVFLFCVRCFLRLSATGFHPVVQLWQISHRIIFDNSWYYLICLVVGFLVVLLAQEDTFLNYGDASACAMLYAFQKVDCKRGK